MGETYSAAGVDIAAGEAAVDRIKDKVRSTYRPEVLGDIGGFGGLVTLPEGYRSAGAGVVDRRGGHQGHGGPGGRPLRHHRHRPGGHVRRRHRVPGRRAAVLPRLHLGRRPRPRPDRRAGDRRRRGLPPGRVRAGGRRDGRAPGGHGARRVRPRRLRGRRGRARPHPDRRRRPGRATSSSACRRRACGPTATRSPAGCCSSGPVWGSTTSCSRGTRWPTSCCARR